MPCKLCRGVLVKITDSDSEAEMSENFISVDIDEIMKYTKDQFSSSSSPRLVSVLMKKNPWRKGSPVEGDEHCSNIGGAGATTVDAKAAAVPRAAAAVAAADGEGRWRAWRQVGGRRPPSAWLDPSRVVIVFATLSSMGTLVLLYLTLSMAKI